MGDLKGDVRGNDQRLGNGNRPFAGQGHPPALRKGSAELALVAGGHDGIGLEMNGATECNRCHKRPLGKLMTMNWAKSKFEEAGGLHCPDSLSKGSIVSRISFRAAVVCQVAMPRGEHSSISPGRKTDRMAWFGADPGRALGHFQHRFRVHSFSFGASS